MNVETETEDMDLDEKKGTTEVMEVTEIEMMDSGNLIFNHRVAVISPRTIFLP